MAWAAESPAWLYASSAPRTSDTARTRFAVADVSEAWITFSTMSSRLPTIARSTRPERRSSRTCVMEVSGTNCTFVPMCVPVATTASRTGVASMTDTPTY